jgi:hypothetical protein
MAFALACTMALSGPALGAAGDVLIVTADRVNVRSRPSTEREVRMQVSRNQRLVEIERQGDWVHAEISGTGGADGWIHASLVAPPSDQAAATPAARRERVAEGGSPPPTEAGPGAVAGAAPPVRPLEDATDAAQPAAPAGAGTPGIESIAPGATAEFEAVDLQRFRDSVAYLNSRSQVVAGVDLFTEVEPLGGGAVQVGATDAWADVPPAGQRSYAGALLERWAAATGRADRLTVQIVDQGGQVLMEESTP